MSRSSGVSNMTDLPAGGPAPKTTAAGYRLSFNWLAYRQF